MGRFIISALSTLQNCPHLKALTNRYSAQHNRHSVTDPYNTLFIVFVGQCGPHSKSRSLCCSVWHWTKLQSCCAVRWEKLYVRWVRSTRNHTAVVWWVHISACHMAQIVMGEESLTIEEKACGGEGVYQHFTIKCYSLLPCFPLWLLPML